jgi:hypothetical protein
MITSYSRLAVWRRRGCEIREGRGSWRLAADRVSGWEGDLAVNFPYFVGRTVAIEHIFE